MAERAVGARFRDRQIPGRAIRLTRRVEGGWACVLYPGALTRPVPWTVTDKALRDHYEQFGED